MSLNQVAGQKRDPYAETVLGVTLIPLLLPGPVLGVLVALLAGLRRAGPFSFGIYSAAGGPAFRPSGSDTTSSAQQLAS
jgi:hypothetical protein